MATNFDHKIRKYSYKLENARDDTKRELYETKLQQHYMVGGGCDYGGKTGTYVLFTTNELFEVIDSITSDPKGTFNRLNSNLPGFQLKVGGSELKAFDCSKPQFPSFCMIPATMHTDLFVTKEVPSIQYTSLPSTDVAKARQDIEQYVEKKNATIDKVINMLESMKTKLGKYKDKREAQLVIAEQCSTKKQKFVEWKTKQKSFNDVLKHFLTKKTFSSDSIKIEPISNATLESCKSKHINIMKVLDAQNATKYAEIKDIVENFTCVIVIDVGKNTIVNVFDIKDNKVIYPKGNEPVQ